MLPGARGMKVIFDFVPNHTSNMHPWFMQSAKRENGKDDWYLWSDEKLSWNAMGNANTWYSNYDRQQFNYGAFWSGMPDLNFRNREVREEMKNVVRFWLNKGFDGLRIDAVRYLVEEEGGGKAGLVDTEATHDWFEELRAEVVDEYAELGSPKFMICEAWVNNDRARLDRYYGSTEIPEFNMVFDFDFTGKLGPLNTEIRISPVSGRCSIQEIRAVCDVPVEPRQCATARKRLPDAKLALFRDTASLPQRRSYITEIGQSDRRGFQDGAAPTLSFDWKLADARRPTRFAPRDTALQRASRLHPAAHRRVFVCSRAGCEKRLRVYPSFCRRLTAVRLQP